MKFVCDMIYFITVLLFGTAVSLRFADIAVTRKNVWLAFLFCALEGLLQISISSFFGMHAAKQLYPLLTHLPLVLFLFFIHKCTPVNAVVSVLSAYMCCQIPLWSAYFLNLLFTGDIAYAVMYVLSAVLTFFIIYKYIAPPTAHFMKRSRVSALLLGAVPLFYYVFDYTTTVYTDWLYSGNITAVQFMPFIVACFYFLFVVTYYKELALKEEAKYQAEALRMQLQHAASTLDHMRQLHENTITYRHDMRHHIGCIQALASSGNLTKLLEYIHTIQSDIEALTPKTFCKNEVINLILSTYSIKANQQDIHLDVLADVPAKLPLSDTNLCAILANALENALHATAKAAEKKICVRLTVHRLNLLIQISNPYVGDIAFADNLPLASEENHGLGTKSIAAIVDSYNGQCTFSAANGTFTLRILLPL